VSESDLADYQRDHSIYYFFGGGGGVGFVGGLLTPPLEPSLITPRVGGGAGCFAIRIPSEFR
jgi:hypothetical protein